MAKEKKNVSGGPAARGDKNGKGGRGSLPRWVKLAVYALITAGAAALVRPAGDRLNGLSAHPLMDWGIPFRLAAMLAGLACLSVLFSLIIDHITPKTSHGKTVRSIVDSAVKYIIGIVAVMWGLAIMGVNVTALLAGAGVAALIIGFGAESLIADVITGIFMLFEHQYSVGDVIVVDDFRGTVTRIGIRSTSITDAGGNVKIINNSDIRSLINRSSSASVAICDLGVLYDGEAVRKAEAILAQAIQKLYEGHKELFLEPPEYKGVQELNLTENAAILRVTANVSENDIFTAQRLMNRELMMALEDGGCGNPPAELAVTNVN